MNNVIAIFDAVVIVTFSYRKMRSFKKKVSLKGLTPPRAKG